MKDQHLLGALGDQEPGFYVLLYADTGDCPTCGFPLERGDNAWRTKDGFTYCRKGCDETDEGRQLAELEGQ